MKNLFFPFLLAVTSCNYSQSEKPESGNKQNIDYQIQYEIEGEKIHEEYPKFSTQLLSLYEESRTNPTNVLLKADNLIMINSSAKGEYELKNKDRIDKELNFLKAELYYRTGECNKSLKILLDESRHKYGFIGGEEALAIAANYTKLKHFDKAKSFVDSIGKGYYIYDFALGNYYETIGDKLNAIKVYQEIKSNKQIKHYAYYPLAVNRLEELNNNGQLLDELYFPTGDPSFDIADSDKDNRDKIFKMIMNLPECEGYGVHIFESPQINDKDYYWIKVSNLMLDHTNIETDYKAKYDFFIYPKDFSIKFYNPDTKTLLSLEEWRKSL